MAVEVMAYGDVVRGTAGFQLIEQPQPHLRGGNRQFPVARDALQPWRLLDALFLKETGEQSELLLGETAALGRILTHDLPTPIVTLHPNYGPLLLPSCLRSASREWRSFRSDQAVLRFRSCNAQASRRWVYRTKGSQANRSETSDAAEILSA